MNQSIAQASDFDLLEALLGTTDAQAFSGKSLSEIFGFGRGTMRALGVSERPLPYGVHPKVAAAEELVARSLIVEMKQQLTMSSPAVVREYLSLRLGHLEHEAFHCLWLDAQQALILDQQISIGTFNGATVAPREVVKGALACNAAAVIFAHNHPSGSLVPSRADEQLTSTLKTALSLVDVRVLDHVIVGGSVTASTAEKGLL